MVREDPFDLRFEDLPATLPIFPLPRAVLLPGQILPLNVFEPRYLDMTFDALGETRMIAMIQPRQELTQSEPVSIYDVGCAGRISGFEETRGGRLRIVLTGVCRFEVVQELQSPRGYRRIRADFSKFGADLRPRLQPKITLADLEPALRRYAEHERLSIRWDELEQLPAAKLVDCLASQLPFDVPDAQALIEARTVVERAWKLRAALEIATSGGSAQSSPRH